jgi:hypothetical protein
MREAFTSQFRTPGRPSGLRLDAKSLSQNILAVSHFDSRFCADPSQHRLSKSFKINILAKGTGKICAHRHRCNAGKSLFQNILATSLCESRFYSGPLPSRPPKSLRMNILQNGAKKNLKCPSCNHAREVGTLRLRGSSAAHAPAALRVMGFRP